MVADRCYREKSDGNQNKWGECVEFCADAGDLVMEPKNAAEVTALRTLFRPSGYVWVGARDHAKNESYFFHSDGTPAFVEWNVAIGNPQPDGSGFCLVSQPDSLGSLNGDRGCNLLAYCVCEKRIGSDLDFFANRAQYAVAEDVSWSVTGVRCITVDSAYNIPSCLVPT